MKVKTFMGKVSIEGLNQMDRHINEWLKRTKAEPKLVQQSFGADIHHDGRRQEPIVVTSVWFEEAEIN